MALPFSFSYFRILNSIQRFLNRVPNAATSFLLTFFTKNSSRTGLVGAPTLWWRWACMGCLPTPLLPTHPGTITVATLVARTSRVCLKPSLRRRPSCHNICTSWEATNQNGPSALSIIFTAVFLKRWGCEVSIQSGLMLRLLRRKLDVDSRQPFDSKTGRPPMSLVRVVFEERHKSR